ncbi:D-alanyl-D-alanine carboxypeptidase family protein [Paenibacillus sp. NEAU-GSW1]|uniref:D-alanyl-D-alanine carboxypeptidase family protein n=1 Tax=Paenibacillus sp. NEAU-GSW1 TaxID=2682486 RepID=UPI0012E111F3|nr:D-alanyl-D-alanine carboxypeptidase family protein [Paenibacillus sp. NEAU-GSW1]MUT65525.1 D-alanyl-D-alanine carboxypeptidase [Paenibacillus sp. NEAU-GSW1]
MLRTRLYRLLVLPFIVIFAGTSLQQTAMADPKPLHTNAKASALIDVTSGRLLYSEDGDTRMRIASLTKIMTAIVAIEHGTLSDVVKTSKRAAHREGSSIYLELGEEMTLLNMLYGLMLRSGNDAATAIAEHVGGSEEGFVLLMNEKAEMIGLKNSQFKNPHGLDEDGHYSSANDLAKLTAYALKNPVFAEIVSTKVKNAPNPHDKWQYSWKNKNKMLSMYEGADGVKTGYTKLALRCLVSSATRNGQQLAAVTINDSDDWADHRNMLDWGFNHYPLMEIASKGQEIAGYPYQVGQTFKYPLATDETLQSRLVVENNETTRFALGERGALEWYLNEQKVASIPIYETGSNRLKLPEKQPLSKSALADYKKAQSESSGKNSFFYNLHSVLNALFG